MCLEALHVDLDTLLASMLKTEITVLGNSAKNPTTVLYIHCINKARLVLSTSLVPEATGNILVTTA